MPKKPSRWLHLVFGIVLVMGVVYPDVTYSGAISTLTKYLLKLSNDAAKTAPKRLDEILPPKKLPETNSGSGLTIRKLPEADVEPRVTFQQAPEADSKLGLSLPLVTRSLARASHNFTCPSSNSTLPLGWSIRKIGVGTSVGLPMPRL